MKLERIIKYTAIGLVALGVLLVGWALIRHNSKGKFTAKSGDAQSTTRPTYAK